MEALAPIGGRRCVPKNMKIEEAFRQTEIFFQTVSSLHPELSYKRLKTWEGPFKSWFRKEVPALGYSKESGVYLFSNSEQEILYIGKAASNNFGAEIYGKFGTATEVDQNDVPFFNNSSMAKWAPDGYAEFFKTGNVFIHAFCISPKEFSSLFEVYLHVWCEKNRGLPKLNKRIG